MAGTHEGHWWAAPGETTERGDWSILIQTGSGKIVTINSGTRFFITGDEPSPDGYSSSWRVVHTMDTEYLGDWGSRAITVECTLGGRVVCDGLIKDYATGDRMNISADDLMRLLSEPPQE